MAPKAPYPKFEFYSDAIKGLSEFDFETLLVDDFKLCEEKNLAVYYAPFDYSNPNAKITIIGITPGLKQMEIAFRVASEGLHEDLPQVEILRNVKRSASFAGTMRSYLCGMLNALNIAKCLGLDTAEELFGSGFDMLNTMSAAKYPIFNKGLNFTGSNPPVLKSEFLTNQVLETFADMSEFPITSLIIPLGKSVEASLKMVIERQSLNLPFVVWGFPHPSGSNGHRAKQFKTNYERMRQIVTEWSSSSAASTAEVKK
jgi:hypothetical protein